MSCCFIYLESCSWNWIGITKLQHQLCISEPYQVRLVLTQWYLEWGVMRDHSNIKFQSLDETKSKIYRLGFEGIIWSGYNVLNGISLLLYTLNKLLPVFTIIAIGFFLHLPFSSAQWIEYSYHHNWTILLVYFLIGKTYYIYLPGGVMYFGFSSRVVTKTALSTYFLMEFWPKK